MTTAWRCNSVAEESGALLFVELTSRCNLHCPFCIADSPRKTRSLEVSEIQAAPLTELLFELKHGFGFGRLMLTGGEPTLASSFQATLEAGNALGYAISIITNGTTFSDPALVSSLIAARVCEVAVSFESLDSEVNRRHRTDGKSGARAVEVCLEAGIPVSINSLLTRANLATLPELMRWAHARGVEVTLLPKGRAGAGAAAMPRFDMDRLNQAEKNMLVECLRTANELFPDITAQAVVIRDRYLEGKAFPKPSGECQIPRRSAALTASGDLKPCFYSPSTYGNLFFDGTVKTLASMQAALSRQRFDRCWTEGCYGLVHEDYSLREGQLRLFADRENAFS